MLQSLRLTGDIVATTTNQTGNYEVKRLAPGKYAIKVAAKGFALYEVDGIDVAAGQSQKMDVSLSIVVAAAEPGRYRSRARVLVLRQKTAMPRKSC